MSEEPAAFDTYASDYDQALSRGCAIFGDGKEYLAEARIRWLKRRMNERAWVPKTILDYGCGTGGAIPHLLNVMAPERVIGVDVSARSLDVARRMHVDPRVSFSLLDGAQSRGGVDLVFCNGVFHHIHPSKRAGAVRYCVDVLKPGGFFAFCENNPWNPGTQLGMALIPFDRDAIKISQPEGRRLLRSAGFVIDTTDNLFFFPRILRFLRVLEPRMAWIPMGAQYMILARKPS